MKKSVKFYMVPSSPWAYLSIYKLKLLSEKYKFNIKVMPIDIFFIFKKYGIKFSLERPIPIQKNRINELNRWKKHLNVKLNVHPKYWPVDYKKANKIIVASSFINGTNLTYRLTELLCEAVWSRNLNINDEQTLFKITKTIGVGPKIEKLYREKKVEKLIKKYTLMAEKDNVFGVPSFVYNKKLFWGQDRLFFLEKEFI